MSGNMKTHKSLFNGSL